VATGAAAASAGFCAVLPDILRLMIAFRKPSVFVMV
jgi:hypothetical protein